MISNKPNSKISQNIQFSEFLNLPANGADDVAENFEFDMIDEFS